MTQLHEPNSNRFYCDRCDTDFEVIRPFDIRDWSAFCPYCEKLIYKQPVCGSCKMPLGKTSKGIRCGHCGSIFTNTDRYRFFLQTTRTQESQS